MFIDKLSYRRAAGMRDRVVAVVPVAIFVVHPIGGAAEAGARECRDAAAAGKCDIGLRPHFVSEAGECETEEVFIRGLVQRRCPMADSVVNVLPSSSCALAFRCARPPLRGGAIFPI